MHPANGQVDRAADPHATQQPGSQQPGLTPDSGELRAPDSASALLPASVNAVAQLQAEFARYQVAAFGQRRPEFFALELCGESGELANIEKKLWRLDAEPTPEQTAHLGEESADVLITILNYANARGIDLAAELHSKLAKIDRRRRAGLMGNKRA